MWASESGVGDYCKLSRFPSHYPYYANPEKILCYDIGERISSKEVVYFLFKQLRVSQTFGEDLSENVLEGEGPGENPCHND